MPETVSLLFVQVNRFALFMQESNKGNCVTRPDIHLFREIPGAWSKVEYDSPATTAAALHPGKHGVCVFACSFDQLVGCAVYARGHLAIYQVVSCSVAGLICVSFDIHFFSMWPVFGCLVPGLLHGITVVGLLQNKNAFFHDLNQKNEVFSPIHTYHTSHEPIY